MLNNKLIFFFSFFLTITLQAQTNLEVRDPGSLYPMAVPSLCLKGGDSEVGTVIQKTILRDFELAGLFRVIDPRSYIEAPGKCVDQNNFSYSDWSVIGVDGLVRGELSGSGSNINVKLYLYDVGVQQLKLAKEYSGSSATAEKIAHKFVNEIMRLFTGFPGVFGSEIAFSYKVGRFKELALIEFGGEKVYPLTQDNSLSMAPAWNKDGDTIVFSTFRKRVPDLFMYNLGAKKTYRVTDDNVLEVGAKFATAGTLLVSKSTGRDSEIVAMNMDGKSLKRIAGGSGVIDISPDFSPDYSEIIFCSNRSGNPQIYVMNSDGSGARRISRTSSNYCTSPAWSPKGDRVAYVCRVSGKNQLFISRPDGSEALQVTAVGNNEDPSFSPDGRYLIFSSNFGQGSIFNLAVVGSDGANMKQVTFTRSGAIDPAWSPKLP